MLKLHIKIISQWWGRGRRDRDGEKFEEKAWLCQASKTGPLWRETDVCSAGGKDYVSKVVMSIVVKAKSQLSHLWKRPISVFENQSYHLNLHLFFYFKLLLMLNVVVFFFAFSDKIEFKQ